MAKKTPARASRSAPRADAAAKPAPAVRADGWQSLLTGLGAHGIDKRLSSWHQTRLTMREEQEDLWRGNDLAARAVEKIPSEMMREGFDIVITDDDEAGEDTSARTDAKAEHAARLAGGRRARRLIRRSRRSRTDAAQDAHETADALMQKWRNLEGHEIFTTALCYERAYGGGAVIIGANDGETDLTKPLNELAVKSIDWLNVLTPREMYTVRYYSDPRAAKYGKPEIYQLMPEMLAGGSIDGNWAGTQAGPSNPGSQMIQIHESRVIIFPGIVVSNIARRMQAGWGDSIFNRLQPVLRDFGISWDAAAALLNDFSQAVFKIKGLAELVGNNGEDVIKKRIEILDLARSVVRAFVIDAEDDFGRKATPVTGLPELLEKFMLRLAAACEMPVSLLMGQAPAGLNATGDSDIRWFYDQISGKQEHVLKPRLERLFRLMLCAKRGPTSGVEPATWQIRFRPLWQLSETDEATRRNTMATADCAYVNAGVLTPEEVAASRFGGDVYSVETSIDADARAAMAEADDDAEQEAPTVPDPGVPPPIGGVPVPGDPAVVPAESEAVPPPRVVTPGKVFVSGHERKAPPKRTK